MNFFYILYPKLCWVFSFCWFVSFAHHWNSAKMTTKSAFLQFPILAKLNGLHVLKLTRPVLDRFHDSSRVVHLICLNLPSVQKSEKFWESVPKAEKYALSMRKFADCYFCSKMIFLQYKWYFLVCSTIFLVWRKKFECSVQTFAVLWREFCCLY